MSPDTHPSTTSMSTLNDLQELVMRFQRARNWECYHIPKNIAMSVAIEAAELMEHFQWSSLEESQAYVADDANRREVADEMADVLIYLLSLAHHCQIDLAEAVVLKMARNETRFPVERYQS